MKKLLSALTILLLAAFVILPITATKVYSASSLKKFFNKVTITGGLTLPTDFAFAPDGRIFVAEKTGAIRIIKDDDLIASPALLLPVNSANESGVEGIAFDPNFSTEPYVYISYVNADPFELRVSRFTSSGDTLDPQSEVILIKTEKRPSTYHHSGTLRFGTGGKLWISVGDNCNRLNAQDNSIINGKILRINKDGTFPIDNPFVGQVDKHPAIWAYGFRNPFRFNLLPDGRPIVGDVGEHDWEEVNIIEKGGNYGWPDAEGNCLQNCSNFINPAYTYPHPGASTSITGGFYYTGSQFPSEFQNRYFFGDYALGYIKMLTFDANWIVTSEQTLDGKVGRIVELLLGPEGSLYYLTIDPGVLYKVSNKNPSVNQAPNAKIVPDKTSGLAPLTVSFMKDTSFDSEGDKLSYLWDFGDGGKPSTKENPKYTSKNSGTFTVKLTVEDKTGNQDIDTVTIQVQ